MRRTFSNRYVSMEAPASFPAFEKETSIYFPNRDELSFRMVLAFPKASKIGLDCKTCCSIDTVGEADRGVSAVPPDADRFLDSMAR